MTTFSKLEHRLRGTLGAEYENYTIMVGPHPFGGGFKEAIYVYPKAYGELAPKERDMYSVLTVIDGEVVTAKMGIYSIGDKV